MLVARCPAFNFFAKSLFIQKYIVTNYSFPTYTYRKEAKALADLDSIYRQNADTVFRFLLARTGSADLSEELTQETFYQAVKSIDRFDGSCRISTWLCGIAKNVHLTYLRKQKDTLPIDDALGLQQGSAEETAVRNSEVSEVLSAIKKLPDPGGEILRLRIMGGLSFKQIGDILGHTETWARVNYYRAKQAVAEEVRKNE